MTIVRRPSDATDHESSNYGQSSTDRGLFRGVEIKNLAGFRAQLHDNSPFACCLLIGCDFGPLGIDLREESPRWVAAQSAATTSIEKGCTRLNIYFLDRHEFALGIQARNTERAA
jgi:hypothetical protein